MTDGERMVWAAEFVRALDGRDYSDDALDWDAVVRAGRAVRLLRRLCGLRDTIGDGAMLDEMTTEAT